MQVVYDDRATERYRNSHFARVVNYCEERGHAPPVWDETGDGFILDLPAEDDVLVALLEEKHVSFSADDVDSLTSDLSDEYSQDAAFLAVKKHCAEKGYPVPMADVKCPGAFTFPTLDEQDDRLVALRDNGYVAQSRTTHARNKRMQPPKDGERAKRWAKKAVEWNRTRRSDRLRMKRQGEIKLGGGHGGGIRQTFAQNAVKRA